MPPFNTRARAPETSSIQAKTSSIRSIRNRPLTVALSSAELRRIILPGLYRLTSATAAESGVLRNTMKPSCQAVASAVSIVELSPRPWSS